MNIRVLSSPMELALAGAELFAYHVEKVLQQKTEMSVVLSGGETPRAMLQVIADQYKDKIPWVRVHFFWGDERLVPSSHPDSNFAMASKALLSKVEVPVKNIHRIKTELTDSSWIAQSYEEDLKSFFSQQGSQTPQFDLVFLGIGTDGHTASLFPDSKPPLQKLVAEKAWVRALWVAHLNSYRISLTPSILSEASQIVFLVSGVKKAEILSRIRAGESDLPVVQVVKLVRGSVLWLVDDEAASGLRKDLKAQPAA